MDGRNFSAALLQIVKLINSEYAILSDAMYGVFDKHLNRLPVASFLVQKSLSDDLGNLTKSFDQRFEQIIDKKLSEVYQLAIGQGDGQNLPPAALHYLKFSKGALIDFIASQMEQDSHLYTLELQRALLRLHQHGQLMVSFSFQKIQSEILGQLRVSRLDSLGRRRDTKDVVSVEVHRTTFQVFNILSGALAAQMGMNWVTAEHPEADAFEVEVVKIGEYLNSLHPRSNVVFLVPTGHD